MKNLFILIMMTIGLIPGRLYAQNPVMIVESTLKLGPFKEEVFHYGLATGDKLIFNFEEINKKELKEVEIMELPSSSKFMEYKTKKIVNKTIEIVNTGIYKFRFSNSLITPRVCKFSIQRIPADASTQDFNTTVYTRTLNDTTFALAEENYIDRTDTVISNFQDRLVKPQMFTPSNGYKSTFNFILPENTFAWSYYIYTNDEGKKIYADAIKSLDANSSESNFLYYSPLAAVVFGENSYLNKLQSGKEITYWIVEGENADLFIKGEQFKYIKKGTAINDFSRMDFRKGTLYFCFSKGTSTEPPDITVKITALHINEVLRLRTFNRIIKVQPKTELYLKN